MKKKLRSNINLLLLAKRIIVRICNRLFLEKNLISLMVTILLNRKGHQESVKAQ